MIPLVRLFEELDQLGFAEYQEPQHAKVMNWIETYPPAQITGGKAISKTFARPENGNRDQLSALETARLFT